MSLQDITSLSARILAYSELSSEEQDASPEADALFEEVTKGLGDKGAAIVRQYSSDPNADEIEMRENPIATLMMTAAQYTGNPFLMMDRGQSVVSVMHVVIGALVVAGIIPQPDVEDHITTPNAGE